MSPAGVIDTVIGLLSVLSSLALVCGRSIGTPTVSSGAATMNTMSSTSITSTIGVTLMSAIGRLPPRRRPRRRPLPPCATAIAMAQWPRASSCRDRIVANSSANDSSRPMSLLESALSLL